MKSDINGSSTCPPGEERYEFYVSRLTHKRYVQYDYRTPRGDLFSCVAKDLEQARSCRDAWLAERSKP